MDTVLSMVPILISSHWFTRIGTILIDTILIPSKWMDSNMSQWIVNSLWMWPLREVKESSLFCHRFDTSVTKTDPQLPSVPCHHSKSRFLDSWTFLPTRKEHTYIQSTGQKEQLWLKNRCWNGISWLRVYLIIIFLSSLIFLFSSLWSDHSIINYYTITIAINEKKSNQLFQSTIGFFSNLSSLDRCGSDTSFSSSLNCTDSTKKSVLSSKKSKNFLLWR